MKVITYAIMNFEVHKNVDKTEYFLGSLITCK